MNPCGSGLSSKRGNSFCFSKLGVSVLSWLSLLFLVAAAPVSSQELPADLQNFCRQLFKDMASNAAGDWARHFADPCVHSYRPGEQVSRLYLERARRTLIGDFSDRSYANIVYTEFHQDGEDEAFIQFYFDFDYRGRKSLSGLSEMALSLRRLPDKSWIIVQYNEQPSAGPPVAPEVAAAAKAIFKGFEYDWILGSLASGDLKSLKEDSDYYGILIYIVDLNETFREIAPDLYSHMATLKLLEEVHWANVGTGEGEREIDLEKLFGLIGSVREPADLMNSANNRELVKKRAQDDAVRLIKSFGEDSKVSLDVVRGIQALTLNPKAAPRKKRSAPSPDLAPKQAALPISTQHTEIRGVALADCLTILDLPPAERRLAEADLDQLKRAGQKVINCVYGPSDPVNKTGWVSITFWYRSVPLDFDAVTARLRQHPFLLLGKGAVVEPPDSYGEALALKEKFDEAAKPSP